MNEDIKFVKRSKYRTRVMKTLDGNVKMPSVIAKDTDIYQNHISGTLKQLRDKGLVECINPEVKKGRLYRLTRKGEDMVEKL